MPTSPAAIADPLIATFGRLVEAHSRLEQALGASLSARCGLPHAWFEVLLRLDRSADSRLTMGELAGQVALTSGGVTRLVDRMATAGLVARTPCATDRRVLYVGVTDAGREALRAASRVHAENLRLVFGALSEADVAELDRLLDLLRAAPLP